MSLNPTQRSDSNNWNYSKPNDAGFSTTLQGTIVAIQEVQAMNFGGNGKPTTPKFWDNGQPVWNIRLVICGPNGGLRTWTIQPAGKAAKEGKKKSVHLDLYELSDGDMMHLIGKTIKVTTQAPPSGFSYGIGNPRPWQVELIDQAPYAPSEPLDPMYLVPQLLSNAGASGGQYAAQPAPVTASVETVQQTVANAQASQAPMAQAPVTAPVEVLTEDIPF